ncbi:alpha-N-acetylgalactosamine-specific lectin-like isoform X2 [Nerophis ophidion]|uniref:alpha-N-acetylgalactosamine-specific lectin-like isoform X2 n=1 Tax=Nerophis ophidion TaxID=159077 RepID=UPI002AE02FD8|nr:alpha-N-acetylgalactosamine-specific lectin-like isoform X2 [Nerophis ophidion]
MVSAVGVFFLLCGISGLFTEARPWGLLHNYNLRCPKGWTQLEDQCYIFQNINKTYAEAENICNVFGGHLASIHSRLENSLVIELVQEASADYAWIGLYGAFKDGSFLWTDGSEVDFADFAAELSYNVCGASRC